MHRNRGGRVVAGALALLLPVAAGGCSGSLGLAGDIAAYAPANAILPVGYSQMPIDEQHYQVSAAGTESTPGERVEKIAMARAAEIGVAQRLHYFKVTNVSRGIKCTKKKQGSAKVVELPASYRPTVTLDVVYAKTPLDADFRSSADTFAQLKSEIDSEVVAPEAAAAASQSSRAQCGAG